MGICKILNIIEPEYIQQKDLKGYPNSVNGEDLKIILGQMNTSICKIKCKDGSTGTGFFCNIPFSDSSQLFPVLITNYHVLGVNDINKGNCINISFNNDKYEYKIKINDNSRLTYSDSIYDISIIEIKNTDNIEIATFLEIQDNILNINFDEYENFKNISIYVIHYPFGNKSECSFGVLINISEKYELLHRCETHEGSSGAPILNISNYKIIGIHKGTFKNYNYNNGTFIKGSKIILLKLIKRKKQK